jgi:hypothetical protein
VSAGARTTDGRDDRRVDRGVAVGYLALLPLLLAYEWGCEGRYRSVAEIVASLPLAPFGPALRWARVAILLVLGVGAAYRVHASSHRVHATPRRVQATARKGAALLPRVWRIVLEGALAALLLGPALLLVLRLAGASPRGEDLGLGPDRAVHALRTAAFLAGGAAWEEIVFRLGVQSLVYLAASKSLGFLTEDARVARAGSEIVSIVASATAFACAHLAAFVRVLGPGGGAFDPVVFTWRLCAGILLAVLFRWRGPGVAAWSHALFDLYLALGGGTGVFL